MNLFNELTSVDNVKSDLVTYKFKIIGKLAKIETNSQAINPYVDKITFKLTDLLRSCSRFVPENKMLPKCSSIGGDKPSGGFAKENVQSCKDCRFYYGTPLTSRSKDQNYCLENVVLVGIDVETNCKFRFYIKMYKAQSLIEVLRKIAIKHEGDQDAYKQYTLTLRGELQSKNLSIYPKFDIV